MPKRNNGFGGGIGFLAMGGDSTFTTGGGCIIAAASRDFLLCLASWLMDFEFAAAPS